MIHDRILLGWWMRLINTCDRLMLNSYPFSLNLRNSTKNFIPWRKMVSWFSWKIMKPPKIKSIHKWMEAFHVFVFIYCSIYPSEVADLMTYAQIVQGIAKSCGEDAAIAYDQKFRQIPVLWIKKHWAFQDFVQIHKNKSILSPSTRDPAQEVTPACLPLLRR